MGMDTGIDNKASCILSEKLDANGCDEWLLAIRVPNTSNA